MIHLRFDNYCCNAQWITYHGEGFPSKKEPPLGPLSGNVAAHTIPFAPSSTGRPPLPPISVATHPGSTEFTKFPVHEDQRKNTTKCI